MSETLLNHLNDEHWNKLNQVIIFGFGRQGWKIYATLKRDFEIVAIVDNSPEKQGRIVDNLVIMSANEAQELLRKYKIIVTTSQYYYKDIKEQLNGYGLVEYVDFVMYQQFVTEWYYKYKNQINVLKTDISLTSKCTLNCKNCMQFLPYWKQTNETPLEDLKENLGLYFKCVDYLLDLDIVGGEPFLYSKLPEFVTLLGEKYRDKIGYAGFITNGTIIPNDNTLALMAKYGIEVSITDYSENIEYNHRIPELIKKLDECGIAYMRNINIDWFDFGFPEGKYKYEGETAIQHMKLCNSIEHVLDNGRLYYCGLEWSAQKGKLYPDEKKGYIELNDILSGKVDKKQVLELILGNIEGGCLDFCKVCGGFGIDNNNRVDTAKQMKRYSVCDLIS